MAYEVKVLADSIGKYSPRITTLQLTYPRMVHAEFMTHRVFSRNASSSRAIPVKQMLNNLRNDIAAPVHWGKNKPGMQANEECTNPVIVDGIEMSAQEAWEAAAMKAIDMANAFADAGYHKQVVNRILEPFSHIHVVVTATDYDNFFALRCHEDAQPEIRLLAEMMREALEASEPALLSDTEWHLPYITEDDHAAAKALAESAGPTYVAPLPSHVDPVTAALLRMSAARCARVSYLTHDKKNPSIEQDFKLYNQLVGSYPVHASPTEHQATPDIVCPSHPAHGNFRGWIQHRKLIPNETAPQAGVIK